MSLPVACFSKDVIDSNTLSFVDLKSAGTRYIEYEIYINFFGSSTVISPWEKKNIYTEGARL
jgi:hypothetical protein